MALVTNHYFSRKLVIAFSTSKYHERSYIFISIDSSRRDQSIDIQIIGWRRRRHLLQFYQSFLVVVILTAGLVRQHCVHVGPIKWNSTAVNLHPLPVDESCYCIVSLLTHWAISIMAVDVVRQHCFNVRSIT